MKTGSLFDQCQPRRDTEAAKPADLPRIDVEARLLIAHPEPTASPQRREALDQELLHDAEEILARAMKSARALEEAGQVVHAGNLLRLGQLLGASARRRRCAEEVGDGF